MKLIKILPALAVFAAAGMMAAGCNSPAGEDGGADVFTETTATESDGETIAVPEAGTKTIKVKFEVQDGGAGIFGSCGIVSTQNDSYLVYDRRAYSWYFTTWDLTITITVPASDEYLNIRWRQGDDWVSGDNTYIKAKMKAESDTITVEYNGRGKVATKNLYDVQVQCDNNGVIHPYKCELAADWEDAIQRAVQTIW